MTLDSNATAFSITSSDQFEITGTPFCPMPFASYSSAEKASSTAQLVSPGGTIAPSTISLTSTKKTSVLLPSSTGPAVQWPTQSPNGHPSQMPATNGVMPTFPGQPGLLPTGSAGGNPGGGGGGGGGGGDIDLPGLGQIVTSALGAGHSPGPGSGPSGNQPGSSPGGSGPSGSGAGSPGSGVGGIIDWIWQSHGGSSQGGGSGPSLGNNGAVVNNVPVNQGQGNDIIIGGSTFQAAPTPRPVTVNGQTFTILPSNAGVVAPGGMTIPAAPAVTPGPSLNLGSQTFSINPSNPSQVIIDGSTVNLPTAGSTLLTISGTTFTLNPTAIVAGSSTVPLPVLTAAPAFSAETVDGIPFDLGSTLAVIDGHTVAIGPGATSTTIVVGSETIIAGPNGLIFPHTTVEPLPSIEVIDGITFGLQPTDVVISGTTYPFAHPTTLVLGGTETVVIGTDGVVVEGSTLSLGGSMTSTPAPSPTKGVSKASATGARPTASTGAAAAGPAVHIYGGVLGIFVAAVGLL